MRVSGLGRNDWLRVLAIAAVTAAVMFRVYHLLLAPWAGDVVRHMLYAEAFLEHGPRVAAMTPTEINPQWHWTTVWPDTPYLYPPLAFPFFILVVLISQTAFAAKLLLTIMEGINAWLCWKISGKKWIGIIYFVGPISIWHVSRNGQYEPVQNLLALLALYFLPLRPAMALGLLVLAVQTKITSAALLPLVLWHVLYQKRQVRDRAFLAAIVASVPGLVGLYYYPWISNLGIRALPLNSYFWNPWGFKCSAASLPELILHQTVSYSILMVLLYGVWRSKYRIAYVAPLIFIVFIKTCANINGWYLILWIPLVLPIRESRARAVCVLLWLVMDFNSLMLGLTTIAHKPMLDMVERGMLSVFQRVS